MNSHIGEQSSIHSSIPSKQTDDLRTAGIAREELLQASIERGQDGFAIFSSVRDEINQIVDFRFEYINEVGGPSILKVLPTRGRLPVLRSKTNKNWYNWQISSEIR